MTLPLATSRQDPLWVTVGLLAIRKMTCFASLNEFNIYFLPAAIAIRRRREWIKNHLNNNHRGCNGGGRALYCGLVLEGLFLFSLLLLSLIPHRWLLREKIYFASFGDRGEKGDNRSVGSTFGKSLALDGLRDPVQGYMTNDPLFQGLNKRDIRC